MYTILVVAQVIIAVALVAFILLQHGKGADAGAAFGSGASGTVFGSQGSANFLSRATGVLATLFFVTSMVLAALVSRGAGESQSLVDTMSEDAAPVPAAEPAMAPPPAEAPDAGEQPLEAPPE